MLKTVNELKGQITQAMNPELKQKAKIEEPMNSIPKFPQEPLNNIVFDSAILSKEATFRRQ